MSDEGDDSQFHHFLQNRQSSSRQTQIVNREQLSREKSIDGSKDIDRWTVQTFEKSAQLTDAISQQWI
jgi:hypothetical protein